MKTLLTTVDTEEEGLWGGRYRRGQHTVENVGRIPAFQETLNRYGVKPTYLVTFPVTQDKRAVSILRDLVLHDYCEIGTHLHPWCNPPLIEEETIENTFPCNLPPGLQLEKLQALTTAIEQAFDVTPRSYRAGRFGFDRSTLPILEQLGYLVDSSVCPLRRWSPSGPNFITARPRPYFPDYADVNQPGDSRILEVPLSIGFTHPVGRLVEQLFPNAIAKLLLLPRLRKLPMLKTVWLRPAIHSLKQMITLSKVLLKNSVSSLNLMLHSSELLPGATPYNKNQDEVNRFIRKIENYIRWVTKERGVQARTLSEFQSAYCEV